MTTPRSTAAHASVAYLRIDGFARRAVAEQARLKARLEESLGRALAALAVDARIVLDAPDGAAVVVIADPLGALRLAWTVGDERELPLAVALAHGPVRVAPGAPALVHGDALATAEAISRAISRGGVSASREFRDALANRTPRIARQLSRGGSALDAQDRPREVFRADRAACARSRRRFLAAVGGVAAALVALGIAARFGAAPALVVPARPATVTFDIRPEGEIYVNGALKGRSPPLRKIQLAPGRHQLEIRSGRHKPLATELVVAAGEELEVRHSFVAAQPAKPFWQRWIDKLK